MRIAYFTNQYPKVSHSFIRREIIALEKQGFDISRIALQGWDATLVDQADIREQEKTKYILHNGMLRVFNCGAKYFLLTPLKFFKTLTMAARLGFRSSRTVAHYVVYFFEACVLLDWMRDSGCKHVHVHFGTNPAQVALFAHLLGGIEYSFTVHGPEEFDMPRFLHIREKVRHAKFVVAISTFGRSQLYRHAYYADWPKIKVVHCGLEESFYQNDENVVSDAMKLVCVGRLCEQKGQMLLLEATKCLLDKGLDFELVLAGDGEMRDIIEQQIAAFGIQNRVRITGWISSEEVRDELINSRALVLPSFAEGLPVVIMEAMALRRPVLTTYVAGIPELVINRENGWLFPAGSIDSLVQAMEQCLKAPIETITRMGDAGRERVIERHDIDKEAAKLAGLFQDEASC